MIKKSILSLSIGLFILFCLIIVLVIVFVYVSMLNNDRKILVMVFCVVEIVYLFIIFFIRCMRLRIRMQEKKENLHNGESRLDKNIVVERKLDIAESFSAILFDFCLVIMYIFAYFYLKSINYNRMSTIVIWIIGTNVWLIQSLIRYIKLKKGREE